ncbi:hypothetical protein M501DRAFT_1030367 [Patellaria atrata CBS 101060]|uniref:Myb-like domain-containing protein n=1 Tax=Patellaria atrata CBS 101060 TaxID=1346257 RepID=A0A9P4SEF3_9PEZI|nr:hypothetical protein M501DRAFT_1030367 [Patellaria atrata CBS 101060]
MAARRYTGTEDATIVNLKEVGNLSWSEIAGRLPGRSAGSLQVRYSRHLAPGRASRPPPSLASLAPLVPLAPPPPPPTAPAAASTSAAVPPPPSTTDPPPHPAVRPRRRAQPRPQVASSLDWPLKVERLVLPKPGDSSYGCRVSLTGKTHIVSPWSLGPKHPSIRPIPADIRARMAAFAANAERWKPASPAPHGVAKSWILVDGAPARIDVQASLPGVGVPITDPTTRLRSTAARRSGRDRKTSLRLDPSRDTGVTQSKVKKNRRKEKLTLQT